MKTTQSSITAQGIAAIRAIESGKPPGARLCNDPLARRLVSPFFYYLAKASVGYGDRKAPGTTGLEKLFAFGYDPGRKTMFLWEGVTYYLTPKAVDGTLEFVRKNSRQRYSRLTGQRLTFGIEEGKVGEFRRHRAPEARKEKASGLLRRPRGRVHLPPRSSASRCPSSSPDSFSRTGGPGVGPAGTGASRLLILLGPLQELDPTRPDDPSGMTLVASGTLVFLVWAAWRKGGVPPPSTSGGPPPA